MVRFDPGYERKQLSGHLVYFACWVIVSAIALYLSPSPDGHGTHRQLGLPPCPSVLLFGRLCPGCGLTTSFALSVRGDFATAFQANLFGPIGYIAFTLTSWACGYGWWTRQRFNTDSKPAQWAMGVFLAAYLGYGVWRFTTQPLPPEQRMSPNFLRRL